MQIVLASGNLGKVREINQLLVSSGITARPQAEFDVEDIEETGLSFIENSILKARNAAFMTGMPAMADDSGLEVDWLQGAPGIYSARYAGPGATDADNVKKLLKALDGVPEEKRTARFQCVMVFLRHATDPVPLVFQGTWQGRIGIKPAGDNGFGYDPVFFVPSENCMAAELESTTKNMLSHRGQALRQLAEKLPAELKLRD